ncbi:secreted RxLR effector protein 161-like [Impatiens glandulifera]|uniref:secreted RxLR effector protein 161-like n=1 Tax=Impatiens glandulifera TaxID=253017 RepID=UPI001FB0AF74|nr:secreted RxLR effector protein 161-like [Impatiens glandulifera]
MEDCNPVSTPIEPDTKLSKFDGGERVDARRYQSLVGSLRYLTSTRPDLMLSVGITSRFMEDPSYTHYNYRLVGYSDSDWCGDVNDRKSTSGYVFLLGNTAFTWLSKKQPIITLSTCEAEYAVTSWSVCHAV